MRSQRPPPRQALAAKAATASIPIVFEMGLDPIKLGLVASLNRPGGNITGVTQLSSELLSKRLGLVQDLLPAASTIGFLVNPTYPGAESQAKDLQEVARTLGLQMHVLNASTEAEIKTAFANFAKLRVTHSSSGQPLVSQERATSCWLSTTGSLRGS